MAIHICPWQFTSVPRHSNFLQCKQVQLSLAAKLCFSVCLCLDMDWRFLRRLFPRLTQIQSGLATVGIGSTSQGTQELVNGNINRAPSRSPVPLLLHVCCLQGVYFTQKYQKGPTAWSAHTAISSNNWQTKDLILMQINTQYSST